MFVYLFLFHLRISQTCSHIFLYHSFEYIQFTNGRLLYRDQINIVDQIGLEGYTYIREMRHKRSERNQIRIIYILSDIFSC